MVLNGSLALEPWKLHTHGHMEFGLEGTGFDGLFGVDVKIPERFDVVVYIIWVSVWLLLLGERLGWVWSFLQGE